MEPTALSLGHLAVGRRRGGFVLIITILLMAFLVLLMVSMASLTRVETQIASNYQKNDQARANALVALNIALGKLQATAGPDQRVSATAGIMPNTHVSKKYWTGIWDPTSATPAEPTWLVSDSSPNALTAAPTLATNKNNDDANSYVRLVGNGTAEIGVLGNEVIVPLQPLTSVNVPGLGNTPATIGRYGWWIGDEGVKARINLDNPIAQRAATNSGNPSKGAFTPTAVQKRLSLMVPARTGGELLSIEATPTLNPAYLGDSAAGTYIASDTISETSANFLRDLTKVLDNNQLEFLGSGFTSTFRKRRFHDLTTTSRGVLADVAQGGLKKDLTAGLLGSTIPPSIADTIPLFNIPATGAPTTIPAALPSWGALRSYVQLQKRLAGADPSLDPIARTDTQMGVHPVITRFQIWQHPTVESDQSSLTLLHFPAVVLWNPYNVTLNAAKYAARFQHGGGAKGTTAIYAECGSTAKWKWGDSAFTHSDFNLTPSMKLSKGFILDVPALAPGEAMVFTPNANCDYGTSTPAQRTLAAGWRTNFWYEKISTPSSQMSTTAPAVTDTVTRLVLVPRLLTDTGCHLFLGEGMLGNTPTGAVLHSLRNALWFTSAFTTKASTISPALVGTSATGVLSTDPAAAIPITVRPAGLFTGTPAHGRSAVLKMSYQPRVSGSEFDDSTQQVAWLAHYNPLITSWGTMADANNFGFSGPATINRASASTSAAFFPVQTDVNLKNTFVGYSQDFPGPTKAALFHLPRSETGVLSLGALQHANVHPSTGLLNYNHFTMPNSYAGNAMPAYAIGNSKADRLVPMNDPDGFPDWGDCSFNNSTQTYNLNRKSHFDLSFILNKTLWDKYYFAAVPTSAQLTAAGAALTDDPTSLDPTLKYYSGNLRHKLYDPQNLGLTALTPELQDFDKSSKHLLVEGGFNINSTSIEAWRAILSSTRKCPVIKQDGTTATVNNDQYTPFPRSPYPIEGDPSTGIPQANKSLFYNGFRSLTDSQINSLANNIVTEIKGRAADGSYGPARSLADFVNRRPVANDPYFQVQGPLQAAIWYNQLWSPNSLSINNDVDYHMNMVTNLSAITVLPALTSKLPAFTTNYFRQTSNISACADAAPGRLTQADLLQSLGPIFTARSDTFRIRTYGEVVDPLNPSTPIVLGRAWCEAIVQRVPEYIDSTNPPETPPSAATAVNQKFGRRFKVVSFRWLSGSDL